MRQSNISRQKRIFGKKKGFTLVEVLIVIIIVGALSSILMISATAAMDKAEATKIVADLKNIKSASILYFADKSTWPSGDISLVNPYLSAELGKESKYTLKTDDDDASVVHAIYSSEGMSANVMTKLKEMQDKGASITVNEANKSVSLRIQG